MEIKLKFERQRMKKVFSDGLLKMFLFPGVSSNSLSSSSNKERP
jgi:hypothetical protein